MDQRDRKPHPDWLRPRWERQKRDTATRVEAAVNALQKERAEVTYASICKRVSILFGLSISPNTIKRNEFAYRIYLANRRPPRYKRLREPLLLQLSTAHLIRRRDLCDRGQPVYGANPKTHSSPDSSPWNV